MTMMMMVMQLLTVVLENIPMVSPFSMTEQGPIAFAVTRRAMLRALEHSLVQRNDDPKAERNHWLCIVDGAEFGTSR